MLKYYPLCQQYAQFLIVPIMLIIMPAYLTQVYSKLTKSIELLSTSIADNHAKMQGDV